MPPPATSVLCDVSSMNNENLIPWKFPIWRGEFSRVQTPGYVPKKTWWVFLGTLKFRGEIEILNIHYFFC